MQTIIARRGDGLSQRIKAIIAATYLAEQLGADLKVGWPGTLLSDPFHSVVPADQFFSKEFINNNILGQQNIDISRKGVNLTELARTTDQIDDLRVHDVLVCDRGVVLKKFRPDTSRLKELFWSMPLSERYQRILDCAGAIDLAPKTVGIHVRGGDVIYGIYRHNLRFHHKVMPVSVAKKVILDAITCGEQPLVFAQDKEASDLLGRISGVLLASSFAQDFSMSSGEIAFFEMALLTRCLKVVGSGSGFTEFAEFISDAAPLNFQDIYVGSVLSETILDDLTNNGSDYNDLHSAFLYYSAAAYMDPQKASRAKFRTLSGALNRAASFDPSNGLYPLVNLAYLTRIQSLDRANSAASTVLKYDFSIRNRGVSFEQILTTIPLLRTLSAPRPQGGYIMQSYFRPFMTDFPDHVFLQLLRVVILILQKDFEVSKAVMDTINISDLYWHPIFPAMPVIQAAASGNFDYSLPPS